MRHIAIILLSILASLLAVYAWGPRGAGQGGAEPAYDRVMRTGTLRCGYFVLEPFFTKDVSTGAYGGLMEAYTAAVGQALGVDIAWTEETGYGDMATALASGRIDAFCGFVTASAERAKAILFTSPLAYVPFYVYVRADDSRFDRDIRRLDDPAVAFTAIDGTIPYVIPQKTFPKARMVSLPQLTPLSDLFLQVTGGKADAVLNIPELDAFYSRTNAGKMKKVPARQPTWLLPVGIAVAQGEFKLKAMIDAATEELYLTGKLDDILDKNLQVPEEIIRLQNLDKVKQP